MALNSWPWPVSLLNCQDFTALDFGSRFTKWSKSDLGIGHDNVSSAQSEILRACTRLLAAVNMVLPLRIVGSCSLSPHSFKKSIEYRV